MRYRDDVPAGLIFQLLREAPDLGLGVTEVRIANRDNTRGLLLELTGASTPLKLEVEGVDCAPRFVLDFFDNGVSP